MMIAVLRQGIVWVPHKQRSAWEEGWPGTPLSAFRLPWRYIFERDGKDRESSADKTQRARTETHEGQLMDRGTVGRRQDRRIRK